MKKIILDLDTGIDDALALTYALGYSEVEVIGITTTFGNVKTDTSVRNTLDILNLLSKKDIPVFKGATHAWKSNSYEVSETSELIHGKNGIGNIKIEKSSQTVSDLSASDFIIQSAKKYGKNLSLIMTGPLTNLANCIKKDIKAIEDIGSIVSMGGALTVPGNITPYSEANIFHDPFAAKYVYESEITMTAVGLDVTLKTLITSEDVKIWSKNNNKASEKFVELTNYYYCQYLQEVNDDYGGPLHDPLAVEVALNPQIVTASLPINLTVETHGESKGRTIANLEQLNSSTKNTVVCLDIDVEKFIDKFIVNTNKALKNSTIKEI